MIYRRSDASRPTREKKENERQTQSDRLPGARGVRGFGSVGMLKGRCADRTESSNTTINYVYNGIYDISNIPEETLSGEMPVTEIETDTNGETYIVVEQPVQTVQDGIESPRTTLKSGGRISETSGAAMSSRSASPFRGGATMADMFAILEARGRFVQRADEHRGQHRFQLFPARRRAGQDRQSFCARGIYTRGHIYIC